MGNKVNRNDRGLQKPGAFCNIKRGYFDINGKKMFFRSKWEANYACYLDFLVKQKQIKKWEYEPDCFIFEEIKFGTRSYRPDFKVTNNDGSVIYHEIKGWFDDKSKLKLKRMKKYYPEVKIILIDEKQYREIAKYSSLYKGWGQEPKTKAEI